MGVENRDYMNTGEGPGVGGWWALLPISDKLIAANLVVFVLWQLPSLALVMSEQFTVGWHGVFEHGRVWTLLTAAFSHQDLWHLFWNMAFLHWFGVDLEQYYGKRNFLLLYLHACLVASLAHCFYEHAFGFGIPALGASGGVMAVVVVAAMFFPQRTILFMWFIPMPLWLLACLKLAGDLLGVVGPAYPGGVAHAAHLGGALAGLCFKLLDLRLFPSPGQVGGEWDSAPWLGLSQWWGRRKRARARPPVGARVAEAAEAPRVDGDTALQVDELLRKIHKDGMGSLSPEESEFLRAASQRYKRP